MGRQNPDAPKRTFRLALFDNESSEPLRSVQFDKVQLAYGIATAVLALLIVAYCLFSFTPLRNTIPGYPDAHSRREAVANAIKVDSLENAMLRWGLYADHLSRVLTGEQKADYDSLVRIGTTRYLSDKSAEELARRDSVLRETVQKEDQFGVSSRHERDLPAEGMHFFTPLKGVVAAAYDRVLHPGIDISARPAASSAPSWTARSYSAAGTPRRATSSSCTTGATCSASIPTTRRSCAPPARPSRPARRWPSSAARPARKTPTTSTSNSGSTARASTLPAISVSK